MIQQQSRSYGVIITMGGEAAADETDRLIRIGLQYMMMMMVILIISISITLRWPIAMQLQVQVRVEVEDREDAGRWFFW